MGCALFQGAPETFATAVQPDKRGAGKSQQEGPTNVSGGSFATAPVRSLLMQADLRPANRHARAVRSTATCPEVGGAQL